MKGAVNRKKGQFKAGRIQKRWEAMPQCSHNPEQPANRDGNMIVRLGEVDFEDIVDHNITDDTLDISDVHGQSMDKVILRPRKATLDVGDEYGEPPKDAVDVNHILDMRKTQELWQDAIAGHAHRDCQEKLEWDMDAEKQWGLMWKERIKCTMCDYKTRLYKVYKEAEVPAGHRGPRRAAANIGLQTGLMTTMISNKAFCNILLSINIPSPNYAGMQSNSNSAGKAIIDLNKSSMRRLRSHLKDLKELKGESRDAPMRIEGDGRFNNPLSSSAGKTPFQAATQSTYTVCEGETKSRKIIGLSCMNM